MAKTLKLLWLLTWSTAGGLLAQELETIRQIREELWYYNEESLSFQPAFDASNASPDFLGFYLGLNTDDQQRLRICAPLGASVWVDKKLVVPKTDSQCSEVLLADWRKQFARDSVFVLLHHSEKALAGASAISLLSGVAAGQATGPSLQPVKRVRERSEQFVLIFSIAFFGIAGFFRLRFPRIFRSFMDANKVLSFRVRDEMVSGFRLLSTASVTIHLLVSLLGGFFLLIYQYGTSGAEAVGLGNYFADWLAFAGIILAFLLVKRLLIQVFGSMFQIRGAVYLQVFEYLRTAFILFSAALFVFLASYYFFVAGVTDWLMSNMPAFAIGFMVLSVLLLFYKMAFETHYQKLHLFSYLCATEILPAILLLKWMFF